MSRPAPKVIINGKFAPCREWCFGDVLGRPTPANPPKYPMEGCIAHRKGLPCMVGRDGKGKYFTHPDEPEWQKIPGVATAADVVEKTRTKWSEGQFAAVTPAAIASKHKQRGILVVPDAALQKHKPLSRKRSPQIKTMPGLSWGDYAYYEENPKAKAFAIAKGEAEGIPLEQFHNPSPAEWLAAAAAAEARMVAAAKEAAEAKAAAEAAAEAEAEAKAKAHRGSTRKSKSK